MLKDTAESNIKRYVEKTLTNANNAIYKIIKKEVSGSDEFYSYLYIAIEEQSKLSCYFAIYEATVHPDSYDSSFKVKIEELSKSIKDKTPEF